MPGIGGWLCGRASELFAEPSSQLYENARCLVAWDGRAVDGASLASAYEARGVDSLNELPSDVAVAVLHRDKKELLFAVDTFGIHSLTYCPIVDGVAFASSGGLLGKHPDVPREIDPQGILDFVYFHMIPSPRSSFRAWKKLPPGGYALFRNGKLETGRSRQPRYDETNPASEAALVREFRDKMRRAVRNSLDGSCGKVGAFLSGGTDSSTISGLLGDLTGEPANTYSIGFDVPGFDETHYARIAVRHFGTNHHEYIITPQDVLEAAPKLAAAYDEPFGNASAVASYYCARLAREDGVDTLFGGDGGDEIFAGNERYAKQKLFEYYHDVPGLRTIADLLPLRKVRSYVRQARIPLPDRLETYNFLSRIPPDEVFAPGFLEAVRLDEPLELLRHTYREAPTESTLHRLLYLDLKFTLADNDLRKVGVTCEMAGVGVRYPFLDRELVDFANRIPPDLKLKGHKLRYFFKRASKGFLPDEILKKSKHGFGVPCGRWMRDYPPLKELAYDSLSSLARRGILNPQFIDRLRALHQGEHGGYYGVMVWVLTMLELWHQHHID